MKLTLFSFKNGLPWLLVGVLSVLLWQALTAEAAPLRQAQVTTTAPQVMSYQGLVDVDGTPFSGAGYFKFAFVDSATGEGSGHFWANDGTASGEPATAVQLAVNNGLFYVLLGDTNLAGMDQPLAQTVFQPSETYLRVWFSDTSSGPFEALEPNQRIASVPYALRAEYAANADALEERLNEVVDNLAALETRLADIEAQEPTDLTLLENRLATLEDKLQHVTATATDIFITGANLHIRNGTGATNGTLNGLGNLIIGYNEDGGPANDRSGSHNLVVGMEHTYTSLAGLVAGYSNTISGPHASVNGGRNNRSTGFATSVSGGGGPSATDGNLASGNYASVSGGTLNDATGVQAWVGGGRDNTASGVESTISGGGANIASGRQASVTGGLLNTANATQSSVTGGQTNIASGVRASVTGGFSNRAEGTDSSVTGGQTNTASGSRSTVSGGAFNRATNTFATVSGGASNTASGAQSTVSGGAERSATGLNNWVGGGLVQIQ